MATGKITNGEILRTILELFLYMMDELIEAVGHDDWL